MAAAAEKGSTLCTNVLHRAGTRGCAASIGAVAVMLHSHHLWHGAAWHQAAELPLFAAQCQARRGTHVTSSIPKSSPSSAKFGGLQVFSL
eukprot:6466238-Amphidinium_carterae.1